MADQQTPTSAAFKLELRNSILQGMALGGQTDAAINYTYPRDHWHDPLTKMSIGAINGIERLDGESGMDYLLRASKPLKDVPESDILAGMHVVRKDLDMRRIGRSIFAFKRSGTGRLEGEDRRKLMEMRASGATTAAELLSGEAPSTAYYVLSDNIDSKAIDGAMGSLLHNARNVPFAVSVAKNEGSYRVRIAPHAVTGKTGDAALELSEQEAAEFLSRFIKPPFANERFGQGKKGIRLAGAQLYQVAQSRARQRLYYRLMENPKNFRRLILQGKFEVPAHDKISRIENSILKTVLKPLHKNLGALTVLDQFDSITKKAWEEKIATGKSGMTLEMFQEREWREFMRPAFEGIFTSANWIVNGGTNNQLLSMVNMKMLQSNRGKDAGIAARLLQHAKQMKLLSDDGARLGGEQWAEMITQGGEVNRINKYLKMLDADEAMHLGRNPGLSRFGNKRIDAFSRFKDRALDLVSEVNSSEHYKGPKLKATFKLHTGEGLSGLGSGVFLNIAPEGKDLQTGSAMGMQFFYSILDKDSTFTSGNGAKMIGRPILLSEKFLNRSKMASSWMPKWQILSQGFANYKRFAEKKGDALLFSPQVAISAAFDKNFDKLRSSLIRSDWQTAQQVAESVISGDLGSWLGVAQRIDYTDSHLMTRATVVQPREFYNNPFDLLRLRKEDVDIDALASFVIDGKTPRHFLKGGKLQSDYEPAMKFRQSIRSMFAQNNITDPKLQRDALVNMIGADKEKIALGALRNATATKIAFGGLGLGKDANSDFEPMWDSFRQIALPGGVTSIRPMQHFKRDELPATSNLRAATARYQTLGAEYITDPSKIRNVDAGVIFSGQEIDPVTGEAIGRTLSAEEMMRLTGAYEQQVIAKGDMAELFGMRNMQGMKLDFDTTKGTIQIAGVGNLTNFEHDQIKALIGVDGEKLLNKHDSAMMFYRGWLQRLAADSGEDAEFVKGKLAGLFDDAVFEDLPTGGFRIKQRGGTRSPLLGDIQNIFTEMNERRMARGAAKLEQFAHLNVTIGSRMFRMDVAHLLLHTAVLHNQLSATSLSPLEQGQHVGRMPLGERALRGSTDARMLMRMRFAGAPAFADLVAAASIRTKMLGGVFAHAGQGVAAYNAMFGEGGSDHRLLGYYRNKGMVSALSDAEIQARLSAAPDAMSKEQYLARYGEGTRTLKLAAAVGNPVGEGIIDELIMPGEKATIKDGGYQPTKLNIAADRVIRANEAYGAAANESTLGGLQDAVKTYQEVLSKHVGGKKALIDQATKRVELEGPGIIKSAIAQDMLVGLKDAEGNSLVKPFDTVVSREWAEAMGMIEPSAGADRRLRRAPADSDLAKFREINAARGYAYGMAIRDPSVQNGAFLTRFVIDPLAGTANEMKGLSVYYHESLRAPAGADSDGDAGRQVLAGFLGDVKPSLDHIQAMESQIQNTLEFQSRMYNAHEKLKNKMAMDANVQAVLDDMTGNRMINDILENKSWGWMFNPVGTPEGQMRKAEGDLLRQRATAETQGLMGAITDPMQVFLMQKAMLSDTELGARMYSDMSSNFGVLREGVLKVKKMMAINSYALERGFRGDQSLAEMKLDEATLGRMVESPFSMDEFEAEMKKSFIDPAMKKFAESGDVSAQIEGLRYQQILDFSKWMHAEHGDGWFAKEILPYGGVLEKGTKRTTTHKQLTDASRAFSDIVLGEHELSAETRGVNEQYMRFLMGSIDIRNAEIKAGKAALSEEAVVANKMAQAYSQQSTPVTAVAEPVAPIPPASTPLPPAAADVVAEMTVPTAAGSDLGAESATLAEDLSKSGMKKNWAAALGIGAALGITGLVFATNRKDPGAYQAGNRQQVRSQSTVRMADASAFAPGYNVQVTADDQTSRPTGDYSRAVSGAVDGDASVQVTINDNRKSIKDQQQQNTINQLKGR